MYIVTCRHVVYDDELGGIPMYCLSFNFGIDKQVYSAENENITFVGSSTPAIDLSFFQVETDTKVGFTPINDIHQGQSIIAVGFPFATDVEKILPESPKMLAGIVSAGGFLNDVCLADFPGSMPNMSGGAVLSIINGEEKAVGILGGLVWHEVKEHRLDTDEDALGDENVEQSPVVNYALILDKVIQQEPAFDETMELCYSSPMKDGDNGGKGDKDGGKEGDKGGECDKEGDKGGEGDKEGEAVGSPFANTRSRALYAMDNAPHKGAIAYFMPASTILRILKPQAIIKYPNVQKSGNKKTKKSGNKKMKKGWK